MKRKTACGTQVCIPQAARQVTSLIYCLEMVSFEGVVTTNLPLK
jgi:hypothetical protein